MIFIVTGLIAFSAVSYGTYKLITPSRESINNDDLVEVEEGVTSTDGVDFTQDISGELSPSDYDPSEVGTDSLPVIDDLSSFDSQFDDNDLLDIISSNDNDNDSDKEDFNNDLVSFKDLQTWGCLEVLDEAAQKIKEHYILKCLKDIHQITSGDDYLVDPHSYLTHLVESCSRVGELQLDRYLTAMILSRLHQTPEYLVRLGGDNEEEIEGGMEVDEEIDEEIES